VLFVFGEQGLGDTIQFSRYLPLLTELGVRVVFEAAHTLHGLLQPLIGDNTLIKPGDLVPEFDYFCPLMSLPLGFKTALSTIPHSKSYLQAPPEKKSLWADRLGPRLRPRVGIAWSGNSTHNKDGERSIPLQFLIEELFGLPFEFVSLQKEIRPTDESSLSGTLNLRRFESDIQDFGDTAALCTLMDLVISVDTSVAHLSAALGCQTWVLLAHSPDWRWLTERADSPWYPSVNLFRQSSDWDWRAVLKNVAIKISQLNM